MEAGRERREGGEKVGEECTSAASDSTEAE